MRNVRFPLVLMAMCLLVLGSTGCEKSIYVLVHVTGIPQNTTLLKAEVSIDGSPYKQHPFDNIKSFIGQQTVSYTVQIGESNFGKEAILTTIASNDQGCPIASGSQRALISIINGASPDIMIALVPESGCASWQADKVDPPNVPTSSGRTVKILGRGFSSAVQVLHGDTRLPASFQRESSQSLSVTIPPLKGVTGCAANMFKRELVVTDDGATDKMPHSASVPYSYYYDNINFPTGPVQTFAEIPRAIDVRDVDNNNKLDILIAYEISSTAAVSAGRLLEATGSGLNVTLTPKPDLANDMLTYRNGAKIVPSSGCPIPTASPTIVLNGRNSDALGLHKFMTGQYRYSSTILLNPPGRLSLGVEIMDFDNDGCPDLITLNQTSQNLAKIRQTNGGIFSLNSMGVSLTAITPTTMAVRNLDSNVSEDVAVGGQNGEVVVVTNQQGNLIVGTPFQVGESYAAAPKNIGSVTAIALVDLDGVGDSDLAVLGDGKVLALVENRAATTLTTQALLSVPNPPVAMRAADLNCDGLSDLVIIGNGTQSMNLQVLFNQGGWTFASKTMSIDDVATALSIADVNYDGLPDILVTVSNTKQLRSYLNQPAP